MSQGSRPHVLPVKGQGPHTGLAGRPACKAPASALTFQSSEHFLVTPTVSFSLTTPLVFFRFFMQPRKAGVEMLNLIWDTMEDRDVPGQATPRTQKQGCISGSSVLAGFL